MMVAPDTGTPSVLVRKSILARPERLDWARAQLEHSGAANSQPKRKPAAGRLATDRKKKKYECTGKMLFSELVHRKCSRKSREWARGTGIKEPSRRQVLWAQASSITFWSV